jgi:hypothetical protein
MPSGAVTSGISASSISPSMARTRCGRGDKPESGQERVQRPAPPEAVVKRLHASATAARSAPAHLARADAARGA